MSRTHIFLRCMHPRLEMAREGIWNRPDGDGEIKKRPTYLDRSFHLPVGPHPPNG
jgi:hypothetical protein